MLGTLDSVPNLWPKITGGHAFLCIQTSQGNKTNDPKTYKTELKKRGL